MWSYWRDDFAEYGSWMGDESPVSAVHFHDEQQLTFVTSGCRYFRIGAEHISVPAGSCLYIPAGCPHRSLPLLHAGTRCLNIYAHDLALGAQPQVLKFLANDRTHVTPIPFLYQLAKGATPQSEKKIAQLASEAGLSREAFTRRFTRQVGIAPHAHSIVTRLNNARHQLRSGSSLAAVAVDCGFFDQTHLARHFYRVFGARPGDYRKSIG